MILALLLLVQQPPPPQTIPDAAPPPFEDKRPRGELEMQNRPQELSVSGRIAAEERKPLPDDAWVQCFCNGAAGQGMFTRGQFRLLVGGGSSISGPPGQTNPSSGLAGCEVRVQLSGFLPAAAPFQSGGPAGADAGLILLRPRSDVSGYSYSLTSALAPAAARKAHEKGLQEARKQRLPQARTSLEQAVGGFERYAAAWFELGTVRHQLGDVEGARTAYQRAVVADAQFLRPLLQLAMMASAERNWPETVAFTERILSRNRFEFPQAFLYHAAAEYNLGDLAGAETSVRRAIELDAPRRLPKAFQLLSLVLAARQEYAEAAQHLQTYLRLAPGDPQIRQLRAELARLESLASGANPPAPVKRPFTVMQAPRVE